MQATELYAGAHGIAAENRFADYVLAHENGSDYAEVLALHLSEVLLQGQDFAEVFACYGAETLDDCGSVARSHLSCPKYADDAILREFADLCERAVLARVRAEFRCEDCIEAGCKGCKHYA